MQTFSSKERATAFKFAFCAFAGMHINDSKCALGSRRDRHENVGRGFIGITMFECIMNDPRLDGAAMSQSHLGQKQCLGFTSSAAVPKVSGIMSRAKHLCTFWSAVTYTMLGNTSYATDIYIMALSEL